jgi:hypothetical protein
MTRTDTWHRIVVVDRDQVRANAAAKAAAIVVVVAAVKAAGAAKGEATRPSASCRSAVVPAW